MKETSILPPVKIPRLQETIKEKISNKNLVEKLLIIDNNKRFSIVIQNISSNLEKMIEESNFFNLSIDFKKNIFDYENNKEERDTNNSFFFVLNDEDNTNIRLDIEQSFPQKSITDNNDIKPVIFCNINITNNKNEIINKNFSIEESIFFIKELVADKIMQSKTLKY